MYIIFLKKIQALGQVEITGMEKASGNYFIILDSDVIVPTQYLFEVKEGLDKKFYRCFWWGRRCTC